MKKGYDVFGLGRCTIVDWYCPTGDIDDELVLEVAQVKVRSVTPGGTETTKISHCSPNCFVFFFLIGLLANK